jgi:Uma2 family endonuclease
MSAMVITESGYVPPWVVDLASFRKWVHLEMVPERGRFGFLAGVLWVDLTMERLVHNRIKMDIARDLGLFAKQQGGGFYLGDGMLLTNLDADLSSEPDGMYIANASLDSGKVVMEAGDESLEVIGSPDMVLEVISPSSVAKDTELLLKLYWKAGVAEYWLVDSRDKEPQLRIYRRGPSRYTAVRNTAGWIKSTVFDKSFRLVRRDTGHGVSEFTLEVK